MLIHDARIFNDKGAHLIKFSFSTVDEVYTTDMDIVNKMKV